MLEDEISRKRGSSSCFSICNSNCRNSSSSSGKKKKKGGGGGGKKEKGASVVVLLRMIYETYYTPCSLKFLNSLA